MTPVKGIFMHLIFALSVILNNEIQAQDSLTSSTINKDNPVLLPAKRKSQWIKPVALAVGYTTITYTCYRKWDTWIQTTSQQNKPGFATFIDKGVTNLGLGACNAIGLAGTSVFAFASRNIKLQRAVITWAGSLAVNSIITDQLKLSFQRHRPNSGDPYNSFDWRKGPRINKSFPSAHTSNAFTTATVFATIYKNDKWVAPIAYTLASLVGLSRIYDNAHWASDVLAGAAVGFLSAKAVNALYKKVQRKILFLPQAGINYYSFNMICRL